MYKPFASFHAVRPVSIGGVLAVAAAAKAVKHTGGVGRYCLVKAKR